MSDTFTSELLDAVNRFISCHENNTGNEPSVSCYERSLYQLKKIINDIGVPTQSADDWVELLIGSIQEFILINTVIIGKQDLKCKIKQYLLSSRRIADSPYVYYKKINGKDEFSSWDEFSDGSTGGKPLYE